MTTINNIVFAGGSNFCIPSFNALIEAKKISAVMAIKPKNKTNKNILIEQASKNNIPIITINNLKNQADQQLLLEHRPELIITCSFGCIVPNSLLNVPKYGWINIHASLLPYWRGASPIQYSLLNGDNKTGVTIFRLVKEIDCGPILVQKEISIDENDYYGDLSHKLAALASNMIVGALSQTNAKPQPCETSHQRASKINKSQGIINWNQPALDIYRQVKAFHVWPRSWFYFNDKKIIIDRAVAVESQHEYEVGKLIISDAKLLIACYKSMLEIHYLQPQGKKIMSAKDFINGYLKNV